MPTTFLAPELGKWHFVTDIFFITQQLFSDSIIPTGKRGVRMGYKRTVIALSLCLPSHFSFKFVGTALGVNYFYFDVPFSCKLGCYDIYCSCEMCQTFFA